MYKIILELTEEEVKTLIEEHFNDENDLTLKIVEAVMRSDFPWYNFIDWHNTTP